MSLDGRTLYVGNPAGDAIPNPNTIAVIDTTTNTVTATIPITGTGEMVVSPSGKFVYAISPGGVSVINTATKTVVATIPVTQYAQWLATSPDGSLLYVSDYYNGISVIYTGETL